MRMNWMEYSQSVFLILSATRAEEDCSQEEYSINARLVCLEALAHVHNVLSIIGKMGTVGQSYQNKRKCVDWERKVNRSILKES